MPLNFSVNKTLFLESLNSLQNICNKKATLAIISNVLIESFENGVFLTGTDLEVGLKLFLKADVFSEGSITLPSKKIFEIVRESGSDTLSVEEMDNSWVTIKAGLSTYNLAGMPSSDFPEFPEFDQENFLVLECHYFLDLIEKCIFSIANEQENIYSLTCVLFEKEKIGEKFFLRMVSSDGHRLSIMQKEVLLNIDKMELNNVTLIPKKGLQEWKKFCENRDSIEVSFEKKQLVIRDRNAIMIIRLKHGEFPQYSAIVNAVELTHCLKINRILFLDSLKRINIFTEDIYHTIQLKIEKDKMILSSQNVELGNAKDELTIDYNGDPLTLGFNCRYFIETLQVMDCEVVEAYINSNSSPCLMKSNEDNGFISVIMPMQL
jgi:DNA polymerase III subunit beta